MAKSRSHKKSLRNRRLAKALIAIIAIVAAVVSIAAFSIGNRSTSNVQAQGKQKRYKATRPIAVDQQTGQARMPSQEEIDRTVASLETLASRPESLPQTPASSGVAIDLAGGFGGVMLARPKGDGTWETKCVFTFEEGVEFLGLVEENSAE
jgi:hypothetical protein